jgi:hypothetical protein
MEVGLGPNWDCIAKEKETYYRLVYKLRTSFLYDSQIQAFLKDT